MPQENTHLVRVFSKSVQKSKPAEKEILWYDDFYKTLHTFKCSRIKYIYCQEQYLEINNERIPFAKATLQQRRFYPVHIAMRLKAEPVIDEVKYQEQDALSPVKWFMVYSIYNDTKVSIEDSNNSATLFIVGDEEIEDFLYQLERNSFYYEIVAG